MKKPGIPKKGSAKKSDKTKDSGELKKPATLKPLKEKEKKSWKNNLDEDDDDDFTMEEDPKLSNGLDDDEDEDEFYDDTF